MHTQSVNKFTLWDGFITCFKKYAVAKGRARRKEYWGFTLFLLLLSGGIGFAIGINDVIFPDQGFEAASTPISVLIMVGSLLPSICVTIRRLHDIGKSGANYFWLFLPVIGAIMLLIWCCKDSDPGENIYGANPKE